jgi:hypothetical protein
MEEIIFLKESFLPIVLSEFEHALVQWIACG